MGIAISSAAGPELELSGAQRYAESTSLNEVKNAEPNNDDTQRCYHYQSMTFARDIKVQRKSPEELRWEQMELQWEEEEQVVVDDDEEQVEEEVFPLVPPTSGKLTSEAARTEADDTAGAAAVAAEWEADDTAVAEMLKQAELDIKNYCQSLEEATMHQVKQEREAYEKAEEQVEVEELPTMHQVGQEREVDKEAEEQVEVEELPTMQQVVKEQEREVDEQAEEQMEVDELPGGFDRWKIDWGISRMPLAATGATDLQICGTFERVGTEQDYQPGSGT